MKKLFIFILIVLLSILLGLYIKQDSGYILISYKTWVIELSFWLGIILIGLSIYIIHEGLLLMKFILEIPSNTKRWFSNRQQKKLYYQTSQGLLKLAEGNYKKAEKLLIKSAKKQRKPLINYLTAAKAAQELRDINKRDEYLRKAFECSPKSGLSIGLMQAQLQLQNLEFEAALATLNHLQYEYGSNKLILKQLLIVFVNLKDWHSVLKSLPDLARYKIYSINELADYEILAAKSYFNTMTANLSALSYEQLKANIDEFYNAYLSKKAKNNGEVVIAYLTSLYMIKEKYSNAHDYQQAQLINTELQNTSVELIDKILKQNLNQPKYTDVQNRLMQLFAEVASNEQHLILLEKYLKADQYNINLLFALGKIAIKHENYEKAFQYLNQAKKLEEQNKGTKAKLPIDNYFAYVLLKLGKQQESLDVFNNYFKAYQQA